MSIAVYIKEIGRGKEGARPLSAVQAQNLLGQVLDGQVTDLEVGAFALAMRIKGETADELRGFVAAAHARCLPLPAPTHGPGLVLLPAYNGARKLPNLTALLAGHLAAQGACVLVHGPTADPTRVTTAEVFEALGWTASHTAEQVQTAWGAGLPAFMPIDDLCPSLARLLAVRWTIGLRNSGHTVAKLLAPVPPGARAVQVVNHTHPEYAHSLAEYLQTTGNRALLMRGTEGEPVADARRQPRFEVYLGGQRSSELSRAPTEGVLTTLPDLPAGKDAISTADYTRAVLAGQAKLPPAIEAQSACLMSMLDA